MDSSSFSGSLSSPSNSYYPSLHFPKLRGLTKYFPPPRSFTILGHRQGQGTPHRRPHYGIWAFFLADLKTYHFWLGHDSRNLISSVTVLAGQVRLCWLLKSWISSKAGDETRDLIGSLLCFCLLFWF